MDNCWSTFPVTAAASAPSDPRILYAAGTELIARSDDGGASWIVMPLPEGTRVEILRVAPSNPSTLYIASLNDLRVSYSAGVTWTSRSFPKSGQFLRNLQVDHTNPNGIVGAFLNFCFFECTGGGVFRSTDAGNSWKSAGMTNKDV
ncbi:MAG: WD40/YVTN/BNR-like repeat-containing protein [Thermoanaerobaculia bacterium]